MKRAIAAISGFSISAIWFLMTFRPGWANHLDYEPLSILFSFLIIGSALLGFALPIFALVRRNVSVLLLVLPALALAFICFHFGQRGHYVPASQVARVLGFYASLWCISYARWPATFSLAK